MCDISWHFTMFKWHYKFKRVVVAPVLGFKRVKPLRRVYLIKRKDGSISKVLGFKRVVVEIQISNGSSRFTFQTNISIISSGYKKSNLGESEETYQSRQRNVSQISKEILSSFEKKERREGYIYHNSKRRVIFIHDN